MQPNKGLNVEIGVKIGKIKRLLMMNHLKNDFFERFLRLKKYKLVKNDEKQRQIIDF